MTVSGGRAASASTDDEVFLSDNQEQASPASRSSMLVFFRNILILQCKVLSEMNRQSKGKRQRKVV